MRRVTQGGLAYLTKSLLPQGGTAPPTATTTILFSHANGFNKEVYLPVWEELEKCWRAHAHASARLPLCLVSFDFSGHGDSRSVQGDGNGKHSDWKRVAGGDLLEMLDALSQTEQPDAGGGGAAPRGKCIGVGHSLGAAAMTMVALEQPGLFSGGLVLVEPVLLPVDRDPTMTHMLAERALKRRATWPSKAAAREYLASRAVFQRWDPRAFDAYIDGALEEMEEEGNGQTIVTLKCKPEAEAGFYRGAGQSVWPQLPELGRTVPVTFVAGENSDHMAVILKEQGSATAAAQALVGKMGPQAKLVVVAQGTHFVVMEEVERTAQLVWDMVLASAGSGDGDEPRVARSSL